MFCGLYSNPLLKCQCYINIAVHFMKAKISLSCSSEGSPLIFIPTLFKNRRWRKVEWKESRVEVARKRMYF